MDKRLQRSSSNKIVAGVCGGFGEYFDVDPVFVRIIAVVLALTTHGFGIVAYIIAWIIMPKQEEALVEEGTTQVDVKYSSWNKYLPGLILIGIGLILLMRDMWYWFHWEDFWPVALVLGGLYLILRKTGRRERSEETIGTTEMNNGQPKPENGGSQQ